MIVHCLFDRMAPVAELRPHPKNRNKHPVAQIERLAQILEYQGWRYAVKVSRRSGLVTSGHGRIEAAKLKGWETVPVVIQDYESDEQEYADVQADNAIASWAELDLSGINTDVGSFGTDFDLDLLGIRNFTLNAAEVDLPKLSNSDGPTHKTVTFTLHRDQAAEVERALALAKSMGDFVDTLNENANGNAISRVCEMFLGANSVDG